MRYVWNNIGSTWLDAAKVLAADSDDGEPADSDAGSTSTTFEELDPSYKPVYRIRDILKWGALWIEADSGMLESSREPMLDEIHKWLRSHESPEGSPEPESEPEGTGEIIDGPAVMSNLRLLLELPAELLLKIVQLASEHDPYINVTISHVNTALRAFTFSFPVLWTVIDLMFSREHIRTHLERSGSSPLHLRVPLVMLDLARDGHQGGTKLQSFGEMIQPHVARIGSLEIQDTHAAWKSAALSLFSSFGALSSLEKFDYRSFLPELGGPEQEELQFDCKPRRIRLEEVGIKTFRSIYSAEVISLKLTWCREQGLTDLRDALVMMPSLQTLEISNLKISDPILGENVGFEGTIPSILLPQLRTLSLSHIPKAFLKGILDALQTPSLTSATIALLEPDGLRGYNILVPWTKPQPTHGMSEVALLPFISGNPQLQRLDLCNCFMTPDMWTTAFEQLDNLKHLRIASSEVGSEALESLRPSSRKPVALPSLTHLTLDNEALDENSSLKVSFIKALITERSALYQEQQAGERRGQIQVQALKSVVLRGWNASRGPENSEIEGANEYIGYLCFEPARAMSEDGEATDSEWESQSEGSWTSGDQAVVDFGKQ
ncbi:hypothetical protein FRC01_001925 [Tulasnella sp. 417]|nr:hypothetical protein FRC01_001925 [Tulasnella sp. 417]